MSGTTIEIFFLGANARNTQRLDLGPEVREIREALRDTPNGSAYRLDAETAVRPKDLQKLVLRSNVDVLHISGHGSGPTWAQGKEGSRDLLAPDGDEGSATGSPLGVLWLVDDNGAAVAVEGSVVTELIEIRQRTSPMRCVVLSACFSASLAEAVAQYVDCVIGMKGPIDDRSAIAFAIGFYRGLTLKKNVRDAFDLGCNEIGARSFPDKDVPELFLRPGIEAREVFVLPPISGSSDPPPPPPAPVPWTSRLRRAVPAALVLTCIIGIATLCLPPACVADAPPDSSTIVVAGRWLGGSRGREARRGLCEALDKERKEGEGLQCVSLPLIGAGQEGFRTKALDAGASLLVVVDDDGSATLWPLGTLANHEIFSRGLPRVDLSLAGSADGLAPLLRSLAHISEHGARAMPGRIRCPSPAANAPRSTLILSLFTSMHARNCGPIETPPGDLLAACERDAPNDECWFAKYLYTAAFPDSPTTQKYLDELQDRGPKHLQNAAALQSVRLACHHRKLDKAEQTARKLSENPNTCIRLAASLAAACVLSIRMEAGLDGDAWLHQVEAFADGLDLKTTCGKPMLGTVLGERAWWRAQAKRWNVAAEDYERAHELVPINVYLLNRTEALLHEGNTEQASRALKSLKPPLPPGEGIQKVLLAWIAEYRNKTATESALDNAEAALRDAYAKWEDGKSVFDDSPDKALRPLMCPDRVEPCAYDVLARPKTSISEGELQKALRAAHASRAAASP